MRLVWAPRQLQPGSLCHAVRADQGHRLLNFDVRARDAGKQRPGEGAVAAVIAVERGLARTRCERDQRALTGLHLGEALW